MPGDEEKNVEEDPTPSPHGAYSIREQTEIIK